MTADLGHQAVGKPPVVEVGEARLGGDDESRRDGEPDLRHHAQVRALAAEQQPVGAVTVLECMDERRVRHGLPPGVNLMDLSLIHISEPTRLLSISYAVFCLKKKKT